MGFRVVDERTYQVAAAAPDEPGTWLHDMTLERADGGGDRSRPEDGAAGGVLHRGDAGRRRERRLQRAGARRRSMVARRGAGPHHLALPAPDPRAVFAGLHVGDAAQARRPRDQDRRAVPRALRSAGREGPSAPSARPQSRPRSSRSWPASKASTRTASSGISSMRCSRRSAPTTIRSTPTASRSRRSRSSSQAASSTACRCRGRSTKSSSIRRASKACTCASARWRAAASAGPTGRRISAPKFWAW